jgi:hypothetical protein
MVDTDTDWASRIPDLVLEFPASNGNSGDVTHFLAFLRRAARKFSVTISVVEDSQGMVRLTVPGKDGWNLDSLLQELGFNQGLYYYLCTVPDRRRIARTVVKPIFEELLMARLTVAYPVLIQKHLMQGVSDWIGGNFSEGTAQRYEMLYQRFKLKAISGYEFVRNLDDLLTEFMLEQLGHQEGVQSPKFNVLVDMCGKEDILRTKDVRKLFNKVHSLRTKGLHRMEREIPDRELSNIAHSMYNVFEWLDDYWEAQDEKTVKLTGKKYRRVRYGQEMRYWPRSAYWRKNLTPEFKATWTEILKSPCHDCGVIVGELHLEGCDMEVCPRCGNQYLCCPCRTDEDYDES